MRTFKEYLNEVEDLSDIKVGDNLYSTRSGKPHIVSSISEPHIHIKSVVDDKSYHITRDVAGRKFTKDENAKKYDYFGKPKYRKSRF